MATYLPHRDIEIAAAYGVLTDRSQNLAGIELIMAEAAMNLASAERRLDDVLGSIVRDATRSRGQLAAAQDAQRVAGGLRDLGDSPRQVTALILEIEYLISLLRELAGVRKDLAAEPRPATTWKVNCANCGYDDDAGHCTRPGTDCAPAGTTPSATA